MVSEKLLNSKPRIVLMFLVPLLLVAAGMFYQGHNYMAAVVFSVAGIVLLMMINRIFASTNAALSLFFDSLGNDDTTLRFRENTSDKTLSAVYSGLNRLNNHFETIKLRNELNESYYKTVIQHASTGLLILGAGNTIELINRSACIYAGISPESTNTALLQIKHPAFYEAVCRLRPGESANYRNLVSGELQLLLFRATMIRRKDEELKLVSIQDIRHELESKELESYRKLISVLTHEIMNHLSPLTSVAGELYNLLGKSEQQGIDDQHRNDVIKTTLNGLKLINEQSEGLVRFMNSYRKISKIPPPEFSSFMADEWVDQLRIAFSGRMKENNIDFSVSADKQVKEIIADRKLLNQVMVNLINNSFDAVMENSHEKIIRVHIMRNRQDKVLISVSNNGALIDHGLADKIFVPFFTTKTNGSGIGLSISQEIMKMHNGSIVAISNEQEQTTFLAEF